ncbi:MAG: hypothetical protein GXO02_04530 [Epsilonproteobacteria bacterium]|nr:hypothetical protein [Campylobacterota bacterium]
MKYKGKSSKITFLIIIFPLLTLLIYGIMSHIFLYFVQKKEIENTLAFYKEKILDNKKTVLRTKVDTFVEYIIYLDQMEYKREKKELSAHAKLVLNSIDSLKINDDLNLIKRLLKAIPPVRLSNYLLIDKSGKVLFPEFIYENFFSLKSKKKDVKSQFFEAIKRGGGFIEFSGNLIKKNSFEKMVAYVVPIKGSPYYLVIQKPRNRLEICVKDGILKFIHKFLHFKDGYMIVSDFEGNILAKPKDIKFKVKNYKKEGLFVNDEYMIYTRYLPLYNWYISAIADMKKIKSSLAKSEEKIYNEYTSAVWKNVGLMAIAWIISILLSLYLSRIINKMLIEYEKKLKESNEKLIFQSRQALLGELLPMIAHQWRQPINKIASVLMRMRFEITGGRPDLNSLDQYCQVIEDSVELMGNTIDDFRSFYKPKSSLEESDLSLVVRKAIYFLDELLERKRIKIRTDLAPITYKIYPNEFLQVIINLIKNAIDAVPIAGQIHILLRELEDGSVELRVEDTGTGIPPEDLEKIFEPHYSKKQGSMGLGLYMSRLIIENHFHGKIEAYNTSRGAGFVITLPPKNRYYEEDEE